MLRLPTGVPGRLGEWLVRGLTPILAVGLFLFGLLTLGKAALDQVRGRERYTIAFADIDCPPPPGQERTDFLGEVQYLGGLPARLHVLDPDLKQGLAGAFARHPWVDKVERVELGSQKVQVQLVYRTPVLAVIDWEQSPQGPWAMVEARSSRTLGARNAMLPALAVDGQGNLLPAAALSVKGLPILYSKVAPPGGAAGTPWKDATVTAAARIASLLQPYQDRLHLEDFELEGGNFVLSTPPGVKVLWGSAPGAEGAGEAKAEQKVQRLLEYHETHGRLGSPDEPCEHDVRPSSQADHRALSRS